MKVSFTKRFFFLSDHVTAPPPATCPRRKALWANGPTVSAPCSRVLGAPSASSTSHVSPSSPFILGRILFSSFSCFPSSSVCHFSPCSCVLDSNWALALWTCGGYRHCFRGLGCRCWYRRRWLDFTVLWGFRGCLCIFGIRLSLKWIGIDGPSRSFIIEMVSTV